MENKYTLSSFIDFELSYWKLRKTRANQNKFRIFFTRKLKSDPDFVKKDVWNNADTVQVSKTKAKQFTYADLSLLAQKSEKYLEKAFIKEHPNSIEDIKKIREEHVRNRTRYFDDNRGYELALDDKLRFEDEIKRYIQEVMLKALFEHFYTPINIEKVKEDFTSIGTLTEVGEAPEQQVETPSLYAQIRLKNPEKYYFSERDH